MKPSGLIIEDDRPSTKGKKKGGAAGANPFSFFASSSSSSSAATPDPNVHAKKSTRPSAPYSIFDEPSTSSSSTSSSAKKSSSAMPSLKTSGGARAGAPSIFDETPSSMTRNPPPVTTKRTTAATAHVPPPSVPQPGLFDDDGFDRMKERLAEQEKLKRKVKAEQGGAGVLRAPSVEERVPNGGSTGVGSAAMQKKKTKDDNPFSFKKFAAKGGDDRRGDEEKDMSDDDEGERGAANAPPDDEDENVRPGENPFSFKTFAKKGAVIDENASTKHHSRKSKPAVTPPLPSLSGDEDDDDDNEEEAKDRRRGKVENPYSFSAFASTSSSPSPPSSSSSSPIVQRSKHKSPSPALPLPAISDSEDDDDAEIDIVPSLPTPQAMEAGNLEVPDFSVDGEQAGGREVEERLRLQIAELQSRVQRAEQVADHERRRASAIERRALKAEKAHARLRKKEEEDTKQLNDVVQAIEHNLMLATARAEKAEAKVQLLEEQLGRCSCGHGGLPSVDNSDARRQLQTINEQSVYLMSQLHKAANEAETGINQLMGGVATLRDIATMLKAIDKMSLVRDS